MATDEGVAGSRALILSVAPATETPRQTRGGPPSSGGRLMAACNPFSLFNQDDISAMAADNGPGNGKAETYAASFAIPRTLHAEERRENLLLGGIGYPGSIVGDDDFDTICSSLYADARPLAITNGIFDEVAACAAECVWSAAVVIFCP